MLVLQMVGEYHLGDMVNSFQHGSLVMQLPDNETAQIPTLLFGTILGIIGVIASIPREQYQFLEKLQVSMQSALMRTPFCTTQALLSGWLLAQTDADVWSGVPSILRHAQRFVY